MDKLSTLEDVLLHLLCTMYDAEKVLNITLPEMQEKVIAADLKEFMQLECEEKKSQLERLEAIFALLKKEPECISNDQIRYMNGNRKEIAGKCGDNKELSDAIMITLNRAMTIHLITTYETAVSCSMPLAFPEVTHILRRSLFKEKDMENKLRMLEETHSQLAVIEEAC